MANKMCSYAFLVLCFLALCTTAVLGDENVTSAEYDKELQKILDVINKDISVNAEDVLERIENRTSEILGHLQAKDRNIDGTKTVVRSQLEEGSEYISSNSLEALKGFRSKLESASNILEQEFQKLWKNILPALENIEEGIKNASRDVFQIVNKRKR
ncbi:hypothetical protein FQA39_LY05011 [Lamprigera yunnana]|nr:hypothetical protein FQA39_LY05011 [Lamprigera yunnana]